MNLGFDVNKMNMMMCGFGMMKNQGLVCRANYQNLNQQ